MMPELPFTAPAFLEPYMPWIVGTVVVLLIFVGGWIVSKWTHALMIRALRRSKLDESLARFLASLAQYAVLAAAIIMALAKVGLETTSLVALLASAGLAIGLALQGSLSHFASGVMLLVFRPFTINDYVEAGGKSGTIDEIGLFATTMITPDNHRVTIPNSSITGGPIINFTVMGKRRAVIKVGVAYGADVDRVVELLTEAVDAVPAVMDDPAPTVVFVDLGASSLDFDVRVWAPNDTFFPMQHAVRKAIYDKLNGAGIDIPFNQVVVHQAA